MVKLVDFLRKLEQNDPALVSQRNGAVCYLGEDLRNDTLVIEVAKLLRANRLIKHLSLHGCHNRSMTEQRWRILLNALILHPTISRLTFFDNVLSKEGFQVLVETFREKLFCLHQLTFFRSRLHTKDIAALFDSLRYNTTLECLQLQGIIAITNSNSDSVTTSRLGQSIRLFLQENRTMQSLEISSCIDWIKPFCIDLAQGLQSNTSLTSLLYFCNLIYNDGAIAFAETIRHNRQLKYLDLCMNGFGDDGIVVICQSLWSSPSKLTHLSLCSNRITARGVHALAKAVRNNMSLQTLNYSFMHNDDAKGIEYNDAYTELIYAFQYNTTIQYFETCSDKWNDNLFYSDPRLQSTLLDMLDHNDTLIHFGKRREPYPNEEIQSILEGNEKRIRTAPKKGSRQRSDMFHWLLKNHIHHQWDNAVTDIQI